MLRPAGLVLVLHAGHASPFGRVEVVVADRFLCGVLPLRRTVVGLAIAHGDRPALLKVIVVVVVADQAEVVDIGLAAILPGSDVMLLRPLRWHGAARERAALVAGDQREGLAATG